MGIKKYKHYTNRQTSRLSDVSRDTEDSFETNEVISAKFAPKDFELLNASRRSTNTIY